MKHIDTDFRIGRHEMDSSNLIFWKKKTAVCYSTSIQFVCLYSPMRAWGVKSRMCPPYPQRDRKRRLNGAVCRNHRIKRVVPCRC